MRRLKRELRHLLLCDTVAAARKYAEDHGIVAMLRGFARREGTAIAELARQALCYPETYRNLFGIAHTSSGAIGAQMVRDLFGDLLYGERDFPRQRVIMEIMRAWAAQESDTRLQFVGTNLLSFIHEDESARTSVAEQQQVLLPSKEGALKALFYGHYSIPDFIDWIGAQPRDELEPIMAMLREHEQRRGYAWKHARAILYYLQP